MYYNLTFCFKLDMLKVHSLQVGWHSISGMECSPVPRPIHACLKCLLHTTTASRVWINIRQITHVTSWHIGVTQYYPEQYREIKHMCKQWIPEPFLRFFERVQAWILPFFRTWLCQHHTHWSNWREEQQKAWKKISSGQWVLQAVSG